MSNYPTGFLRNIAIGKRGVSYKPEDIVNGDNQPFKCLLTSGNIQAGITNTDSFTKIAQKCVSDEQLISKNDILVCMSNGSKRLVGKSSRLSSPDSKRFCVGAFCSTFSPTKSANADFVFHVFQSDLFKNQVYDAIEGSAINNLKNSTIEEFQIPIPPLPEQKKIAEILSGIDDLIIKKKDLNKKNNLLLKASIEDLMKGDDNWDRVFLSEILLFKNGLNTSKENFGFGTPFVSYKNVSAGGLITVEDLSECVSLTPSEEDRFCLKRGDILFTRTSETPAEIGFSAVYNTSVPAVFNGFCIRGRPSSDSLLIPEFSSFCFRSNIVLSQMRSLCKYTTRAGISAESLGKVQIMIPPINVQEKIANSLSSIKQLIRAVDKSIHSLENLKHSISHELLSGRKRINI